MPETTDHFPHPGGVCPHLDNHTRPIQCLKEFCNVLRCRPHLSFRQRLSLQTQNAVMAPLVPKIYSHRQTVKIGTKLGSRMLFNIHGHSCDGLHSTSDGQYVDQKCEQSSSDGWRPNPLMF